MNKRDILERVSEEDIFSRYLGPARIGKMINSPLRKDSTPSFHVFRSTQGGLIWKDFGSGETGDCFKLIQLLFRVDFVGALKIIEEDFNLVEKHRVPVKRNTSIYSILKQSPKEERSVFEYEEKEFTQEELSYWNQYGITKEVLSEYGVISVLKVKESKWKGYINSTPNCPIFAYKYPSGNIKFYRPLAFDRKFFGNSGKDDIFGYEQAFKESESNKLRELALCAGQKDVMSFYANTGIRAISLNSESAKLTEELYGNLTDMAHEIVVCYDMDKTGRANSLKICSEYSLRDAMGDYLLKDGEKDISDYFKRINKQKLITI